MNPYGNLEMNQWVEKARLRVENLSKRVKGVIEEQVVVEPPLTSSQVDALVSELGRPMPGALRAFLEGGSSGFNFRYKWRPQDKVADIDVIWGRGELCKASEFALWLSDCKESAENAWIAEYPDDLAMWTASFPILRMDNADFIALDQRTGADDPQVLYLSHDEESLVIAPSFSAFLREWERVHYIGPESWMIEPFVDGHGLLNGDTEAARELRAVYGDMA
jgi:hypothetical protein